MKISQLPDHYRKLKITNSLSKEKETFNPGHPPHLGMYVCGPTVYGDAHLGHARTYVSFDLVYRWLMALGFKVRYVRNITDVGHLIGDADEGDDKIGKQARLEQKEPMEIAQHYANGFHADMDKLNVKRPSIEPLATGHLPEQIKFIERILDAGLAYEANGSVYFDVRKYNEQEDYGILSGRDIDELKSGSRENLKQQDEKRHPNDFALWKKADKSHLMRWESPWSVGFPGWHLECSAMGHKYLGEHFDIHGGGMDLMFPHHECEIAQSKAATKSAPCRYWMHTNMITVNGQKMGKSLGNAISLKQVFTGDHDLLEQAFSPMTVRFFILQAHYRGTLDFSSSALKSAETALRRLMNTLATAKKLKHLEHDEQSGDEKLEKQVAKQIDALIFSMNDDFNSAKVIAGLNNMGKRINALFLEPDQRKRISSLQLHRLIDAFVFFTEEVLGLREEEPVQASQVVEHLLPLYARAKAEKDYERVDELRASLKEVGVKLKDTKTGPDWEWE